MYFYTSCTLLAKLYSTRNICDDKMSKADEVVRVLDPYVASFRSVDLYKYYLIELHVEPTFSTSSRLLPQ
jgi:hypothetical protein